MERAWHSPLHIVSPLLGQAQWRLVRDEERCIQFLDELGHRVPGVASQEVEADVGPLQLWAELPQASQHESELASPSIQKLVHKVEANGNLVVSL